MNPNTQFTSQVFPKTKKGAFHIPDEKTVNKVASKNSPAILDCIASPDFGGNLSTKLSKVAHFLIIGQIIDIYLRIPSN